MNLLIWDHPKNGYFLPLEAHMYMYVSGGKKWQFFGNFCVRTKCMIPVMKVFKISTLKAHLKHSFLKPSFLLEIFTKYLI